MSACLAVIKIPSGIFIQIYWIKIVKIRLYKPVEMYYNKNKINYRV